MPPSRSHRDATTLPAKLGALGDVRRQTAHQLVHEQLRLAILGGNLAPGTPLVLSDLSEQLGTSRTPIREAIRDLATEGLVDFDAYRSPVVHVPTLTEAREIYELRLVLEPLGIKTAMPRLTEADFDAAESLHKQMIDATGNVGEWVELNRQFHAIFTGVVVSSRLRSVIANLRDAAAVQVAQSIRMTRDRMETGNAEHARILAAYRGRDVDAASEETRTHLQSTLQVIEEYYTDRLEQQA